MFDSSFTLSIAGGFSAALGNNREGSLDFFGTNILLPYMFCSKFVLGIGDFVLYKDPEALCSAPKHVMRSFIISIKGQLKFAFPIVNPSIKFLTVFIIYFYLDQNVNIFISWMLFLDFNYK